MRWVGEPRPGSAKASIVTHSQFDINFAGPRKPGACKCLAKRHGQPPNTRPDGSRTNRKAFPQGVSCAAARGLQAIPRAGMPGHPCREALFKFNGVSRNALYGRRNLTVLQTTFNIAKHVPAP